jgi:tripartite-type tricarboxylate transporter receptor subunit TctC
MLREGEEMVYLIRKGIPVLRGALLAGITASLLPSAALADVVIPSRVSVLIGTTPGGGTDGTSRLVGKFLSQYLPGKPQMIYRNMPSGGGLQATNYFSSEAKADGSLWMGGDGDYIDAESVRNNVAKFDPRTFMFIGGILRGGTVMLVNKSKLADLEDKSKPPVTFGSQDGTGSVVRMAIWGAEALGWNLRFVIGYPSSGAMSLALRRGEIDAFGTSNNGLLDPLLKSGNFKGVIQEGLVTAGVVAPRSSYPTVPTIRSLVAHKLSGVAKETFEVLSSADQIDKWFALPPRTPASVVAAYRDAFTKAVRDPNFIKAAKLQFSADNSSQTGDELAKLVALTSFPSATVVSYETTLRAKYGLPTKPLTDSELAALARKLVTFQTTTAVLDNVEREGRVLVFKVGGSTQRANVSGSRTQVTVGGKKVDRKALKPGMKCEVTYSGNGGEAQKVQC